MNESAYRASFSVVDVTNERDLFYLNMRIYEVMPSTPMNARPDETESVIWCAIFKRNVAEPLD